jgi:hypothetical protein
MIRFFVTETAATKAQEQRAVGPKGFRRSLSHTFISMLIS